MGLGHCGIKPSRSQLHQRQSLLRSRKTPQNMMIRFVHPFLIEIVRFPFFVHLESIRCTFFGIAQQTVSVFKFEILTLDIHALYTFVHYLSCAQPNTVLIRVLHSSNQTQPNTSNRWWSNVWKHKNQSSPISPVRARMMFFLVIAG